MPSIVPVACATLGDDGDTRVGGALQLGEYFVCVSLQTVSGKYRDGLAKNLVSRRTAAAEVVVVEGGQIVVDERVGVQHLER